MNIFFASILKIFPPIVIPEKLIEIWLKYRIKIIKSEFEKIIWRLSYYVASHGTTSTCFLLFIPPRIFMRSSKRANVFITKCHEGFDKAQNEIVELLPKLEAKLPDLLTLYSVEVRRYKKEKKPPVPRYSDAGIAYSKQLFNLAILRELANSIAWQILGNDGTRARAFIQGLPPNPIQRENLEKTLEIANRLNSKDKTSFALITDITSCIQVGDLLVRLPTGQFGLCELKDGIINTHIEELLEESPTKQATVDKFNQLATKFGKSFIKQFERVLRQKERMEMSLDYINNSVGIDIQFKKRKVTDINSRPTLTYHKEINDLLRKAKKNGENYIIIDGCLMLGAFNTIKLNRSNEVCKKDFQHQVWHIFFESWQECPYGKKFDEQKVKKHFEYMLLPVWEMKDKVYIPTHRPIFISGLSKEFVFDILFERLALFFYFSPQKFVELCKTKGIDATWIIGKEYNKTKNEASKNKIVLLDIHGGIIKIEYKAHHFIQHIALGTLYKIIYEFERPSSIAQLIKEDESTLPERLQKLESSSENGVTK